MSTKKNEVSRRAVLKGLAAIPVLVLRRKIIFP